MILETLKNKLLTLGIPGLLLISFLDSAGVPLPGGADLVVMLLSWQRPAHLSLIAIVAALGSVLGSLVLYRIARTKGDAMMSPFPKEKQDRVKEKFRRNDILAILVAMLGPPPLPTKLFVLVAGVVRMDWRRFVAAVFAGRLIRFLGVAYLAVKLGDRAAETLRQRYPSIVIRRGSSNDAAILEKPGSDRGTLEDLSQSPILTFKQDCKLLILTERCQSGRSSTLGKRIRRRSPRDTEIALLAIESMTSRHRMLLDVNR